MESYRDVKVSFYINWILNGDINRLCYICIWFCHCCLVAKSGLILFATLCSSVHGILQARILEWIAGRYITTEPPGKPCVIDNFTEIKLLWTKCLCTLPFPNSYVDTLTPNVMVFLGLNEVRVRPHDGTGGCIKWGRFLPCPEPRHRGKVTWRHKKAAVFKPEES